MRCGVRGMESTGGKPEKNGGIGMKQIAWIGTGVMGSQQAGHLAKAGYQVKAYTHKYEKLLELQKEFGLIPCKSTAEAVEGADVIFVMVGYPHDVEEVFLQEGGILQHAKPGALAIDMTTSSPSLAVRLYEEGKKKGIRVMDAPVSGGDSGARNGTLSIMVGGDEADFKEALPLFECMGKNIVHMGGPGYGQPTRSRWQALQRPIQKHWSMRKKWGWTPINCWKPLAPVRPAAGSFPTWRPECSKGIWPPASLSSTLSKT